MGAAMRNTQIYIGGRLLCFFFSSRRRHTRLQGDWSSDVCSSDLTGIALQSGQPGMAALWEAGAALWDGFFGNRPAARQGAAAALERSTDRDVEYGADRKSVV